MTIPSTKASTANVDSGSDLIANARADIKQNIDNVNEIIDHLNALSSLPQLALIEIDSVNNFYNSLYRRSFTVLSDTSSILTQDSASGYYFTLQSGTYWFEPTAHTPGSQNINRIGLYDDTDTEDVNGRMFFSEVATSNDGVFRPSQIVTVSTATTYYLTTNNFISEFNPQIKIWKMS